jgi:transcriptional regulator with XRE-family HTH domain/tetratricopeptide (TPR) repeat protein
VARTIRGWSQESFASRIRVAAREHRINLATTKKTVARWEQGVVPDIETQELIAQLLEVPVHLIHVSPWPNWIMSTPDYSDNFSDTNTEPLLMLERGIDSIYLDNRMRPLLLGAGLILPIYKYFAREGLMLSSGRGRVLIGAETVERLELLTKTLRDLGDQVGGGLIRGVVREQLSLCHSLIKDASYSPNISTRLYSLTGSLAQLAGFNEVDMGRHAPAQKLYMSALKAAQVAGDRPLGAYILSWLSYQSYTSGNSKDGAEISSLATTKELTKAPKSIRSLLLARGALANAALRDSPECSRSLALAEKFNQSRYGDKEDTLASWFTGTELLGTFGRSFLEMGDNKQAEHYLRQALESADDPLTPRSKVIYHARIGQAIVRQGEIARARGHAEEALELATSMKSERNHAVLRELSLEMLQSGSKEAVEFAELLADSTQ